MKRVWKKILIVAVCCLNAIGNPMMANAEDEKIVVALDPGHDAKHSGATAGGLLEHELTIKIANYCKAELEKYGNIEVYLTRMDNTCPYPYTSKSADCIRERMLSAKNAGAALYVSLHLNAQDGGTSVQGAEVIYPNDSWKWEVGNTGKALAQNIQNELVALGLHDRGIYYKNSTIGELYPDGSKSDYYTVQISGKEHGIPNVIVENAFITNASDRENFLNSEEGLRKLGEANARAIANTLGLYAEWRFIDGNWYYYYGERMITGWFYIRGTWYFLDENGVMQTDWIEVDGIKYYMNAGGAMQTGWKLLDGKWYYFSIDGYMRTGWCYVNQRWYYMDGDGVMQTGWVDVGGTRYYLDASGAMQTSWRYIDGTWYYLDASGAMRTGWLVHNGNWYYLNQDGIMQTGWIDVNGVKYYVNASGAMLTDWQYVDGSWYYMDASGAMSTGWQYVRGFWYYMDGNGVMQTGWQCIDGIWYFMNAGGAWIA